MKHIYTLLLTAITIVMMGTEVLNAQQQVTVRDLNTYPAPLTSQADLPNHPLVTSPATIVTFDAVVVAYPKNSGLASISPDSPGNPPGRIHLFVTDVNAIDDGRDGMSIQFVVEGSERTTLESLPRGSVIRVEGNLAFFGNTGQFNATSVEELGSIQDAEYEDLAPLLEPTVISLSELNIPSDVEGRHKWNADNYSIYNNRYVKIEGLEVIDRIDAPTGRPWFVLSDGTSIITSNDTSLRFRNDLNDGNRSYQSTGLGYNYRRLSTDLDGPFTPPAAGSVVDISGFIVVNTFDPAGFDESGTQSTLKIAPWDDGIVWSTDGTDTANRSEPDGWPIDLVVKGFAPLLEQLSVSPGEIFEDDAVTVSVDVLLPEVDYTLESVEIEFTATGFDGTEVTGTEAMTASGDTHSYTFADGFDAFTLVSYTITATTTASDGVTETRGRVAGNFAVGSATQTSPVVFSPAAGEYVNFVEVSMSTPSPDSTIYYTTDGTDPDVGSTEYTGPITVTSTSTVKAIAVSGTLDPSPIATANYVLEFNDKETLTALRTSAQGQSYRFTGEAVVTYARSTRNQKYLMDSSGGLLVDDNPGVITSTYVIGDVMTGLIGNLGAFNGHRQFLPQLNPGDPTSTAAVNPTTITLAELDLDLHESMLVRIENVSFLSSGNFAGNTNYNITDPSLGDGESRVFRSPFFEANYIGQPIPEDNVNMIVLVNRFNAVPQVAARSQDDFEIVTSNELSENPDSFSLNQNYPNPFNPSTLIRYNIAEASDVRLAVYDILGRRVATLVNELQTPGAYTVSFNANHLASGTYIYRLEAGNFVSIKKMMLIK